MKPKPIRSRRARLKEWLDNFFHFCFSFIGW